MNQQLGDGSGDEVCTRLSASNGLGSGGSGEKFKGVDVGWSDDGEVSIVERRYLGFSNAFSDRDQGCVNEVEG